MSLLIGARLRALWHVKFGWTQLAQAYRKEKMCHIWRLYSHFGFRSYWIGCECGYVAGRVDDMPLEANQALMEVRLSGFKKR